MAARLETDRPGKWKDHPAKRSPCYLRVVGEWLSVSLMTLVIPGCEPTRTPYPQAFQSQQPEERLWAIKKAAEIQDQSAIDLLVDCLEDDDEAIRFYAILALDKLTGRRFGYDYYGSAQERRWAVQRWRRYLGQEGIQATQPQEEPALGAKEDPG